MNLSPGTITLEKPSKLRSMFDGILTRASLSGSTATSAGIIPENEKIESVIHISGMSKDKPLV